MRKRISLLKAYSDLGIYTVPHHATESNQGVRWGANAVANANFLNSLNADIQIHEFSYTKPEDISVNEYFSTLHKDALYCSNVISQDYTDDAIQLMIGGDHSTSFATFLTTLKHSPHKNIGYIQFDSHADLNNFSQSPTGNFHGMFLRPFFDNFDVKTIDELIPHKLSPQNLLYIGNLMIDEGEVEFINQKKIQVIEKDCNKGKRRVEEFLNDKDHIHLSFDIDVFKQSLAPATGTPNPNGLDKQCVFALLEIIKKSPKVSIDLVEVNPMKDGSEQTIKLAQEVLKFLLT